MDRKIIFSISFLFFLFSPLVYSQDVNFQLIKAMEYCRQLDKNLNALETKINDLQTSLTESEAQLREAETRLETQETSLKTVKQSYETLSQQYKKSQISSKIQTGVILILTSVIIGETIYLIVKK